MNKLSLKEYKKRCAELWDWLADNPKQAKTDCPIWIWNGGKYNIPIGILGFVIGLKEQIRKEDSNNIDY